MIVIKFGLHRKNRKPKKKETNHAKICRKFSNRMQADQRANLRLIVDDLALLLGCFYDPDVIPPDLFALFGLNQQKGENLVDLPISVIETDRTRHGYLPLYQMFSQAACKWSCSRRQRGSLAP